MSAPVGGEEVRERWLNQLRRTGREELRLLSGSMAPLLKPGDHVLVVLPSARRLWPGDLVVFQEGGQLVCHRLRAIYAPGRYLQKGDASLQGGRLRREHVIGTPVHVRVGDRIVRLRGGRFRILNTLLWLLLVGRDFLCGCSRPIPGLRWRCARWCNRIVEALVGIIRAKEEIMDPLRLTAVPRPAEQLVLRQEDDEIYICGPDGETMFTLAAVGADIWRACDGRNTVADILAMLVANYNVEKGTAEADLQLYLRDLESRNLIHMD
jgi:hypothetical protein